MSDLTVPRRAPIGFHVTMRLDDGRAIATSPSELRIVARVLHEQGAPRGLLAFDSARNHLHALLASLHGEAGAFCRYVETALVWQLRLGARFERARIRPLQDQRHAQNAFQYVLRQDERHAITFDPTREGSSLPDFFGLRALPTSSAIIANARSALPHLERDDILPCFRALAPALAALDAGTQPALDRLAAAATAAFALPDLRGRTADAARARRAAVHAAGPDVSIHDLSDALHLQRRAIKTLQALPIVATDVRAVRGQAALLASIPTRSGACL